MTGRPFLWKTITELLGSYCRLPLIFSSSYFLLCCCLFKTIPHVPQAGWLWPPDLLVSITWTLALYVPPSLVYKVPGPKPRVLCMLGKYSPNAQLFSILTESFLPASFDFLSPKKITGAQGQDLTITDDIIGLKQMKKCRSINSIITQARSRAEIHLSQLIPTWQLWFGIVSLRVLHPHEAHLVGTVQRRTKVTQAKHIFMWHFE